jgi:hypothetical protein
MSKNKITLSLCFSLLLVCAVFVTGTFAADVETDGDLKVNGVVESTSGGFKFPNGTTLTSIGNISANSASTAFQVTQSGAGHGIDANSMSGDAVHASATNTGVYGASTEGVGVLGYTTARGAQNAGVKGLSQSDANGVYGENSDSGYGVVGYASGSASLAAGRFASSSTSGTALIAESPANTQVMKVDAKGIHAGPGMTGTPLAYGRFNATGSRTVGSSNISCGWDSVKYQCTISGEDYFYGNYVTIVTPNMDLAIPVVGSSTGKLWVSFYNLSGSLIQPTGFSVAVYKP